VRLPVAPLAPPTPPSEAPAAVGPEMLAGLRIVVVDDQADARDFLTIVLGRHGADVTLATSAAEALAAIEAVHPDVVLADIAMPDEDGYMLVRRLRAFEAGGARAVRAIALTALASPEDRERALAAGFDLHLPKPIDPVRLVGAVARAVGRSGAGVRQAP
jgi:CheY-like chemotaxis protein